MNLPTMPSELWHSANLPIREFVTYAAIPARPVSKK